MKKIIFTQEWMFMHPYKKVEAVDLYYTDLANKIYHALDNACFPHQFKDVQDAKNLALCIAAYFEDVLSGTCIWKTFTTECHKRYGVYIPFYQEGAACEASITNNPDGSCAPYNQDDINIADIKFLLWHHFQQCNPEPVPPLFGPLEIAAKMVYDVLNADYETAPENERMHEYLCTMPTDENHYFEFRNVLEWFHYGCFFNVGNRRRLANAMQWLANIGNYNEVNAYTVKTEQPIMDRTNLLAFTSLEWLAKISEHHTAHKLWTETDFRNKRFYQVQKVDDSFITVKDLFKKDVINIDKRSINIDDFTPLTESDDLMIASVVKFGEAWWLNGIMQTCKNDKEAKKAVADGKDVFNHKQAIHDYNLLKDNGYGSMFLFADGCDMVKEFCKNIGYELPKDFAIPKAVENGIIVSGSPYTGLSITVAMAHCICSPDNPYYNSEKAEENCFDIISGRGNAFPYEIVRRLIDNNMLPDANIFTSKYVKEIGKRITQENLYFLADYYLMGRPDKDFSPIELW